MVDVGLSEIVNAVAVTVVLAAGGKLMLRLRGRVAESDVTASEQTFRTVRETLSRQRRELAIATHTRYGDPSLRNLDRLAESREDVIAMLAPESWLPEQPVALRRVITSMTGRRRVKGDGRYAGFLPLTQDNSAARYDSYWDAIEKLDKPLLFWPGNAYRLVDVSFSSGACELQVGDARYDDFINTCEVLAYLSALDAFRTRAKSILDLTKAMSKAESVRKAPLDLDNRSANIGMEVVTIVQSPEGVPQFLQHFRGAKNVSSAMGSRHVIPAGEFQPEDVFSDSHAERAPDLWTAIRREFAEELAGFSEEATGQHGRFPAPLTTFYGQLDQAYASGAMRLFLLGVAIDSLTLKPSLLLAAVFDSRTVFDELFPSEQWEKNQEGVNIKLEEFREQVVFRFVNHDKTLPAGSACVALAWSRRAFLLDPRYSG